MDQYDIEKRLRAETDRALKKLGLETPPAMTRTCIYCSEVCGFSVSGLCDVCSAHDDAVDFHSDWFGDEENEER